MAKSLQIICATSISIIALSFFYYFIVRPIQKDQSLEECFKFAVDKHKGSANDERWNFLEETYQFCIKEKGL